MFNSIRELLENSLDYWTIKKTPTGRIIMRRASFMAIGLVFVTTMSLSGQDAKIERGKYLVEEVGRGSVSGANYPDKAEERLRRWDARRGISG